MNHAFQGSATPAEAAEIPTKSVVVAAQRISRGTQLTTEMVKEVDWPETLTPGEVLNSVDDAVGRVAMSTVMPGEPLFKSKLSKENGEGFIGTIIKPGMRAYTIQTKGPSATVAGLVRPQDQVDVLVNIRGTTNDETGGGSSTTLLQSVEILAIDQMLDPNPDPLKMLEMWTKGNNFTSVTLEVTPAQASLLALGQSYGELSLSLRRLGDSQEMETLPATIRDIRLLELTGQPSAGEVGPNKMPANPIAKNAPPPRPTFIHTLRGSESGRINLLIQP
jgi:pilus assembly protein CpaB